MGKWKNILKEKPDYYSLKLVMTVNCKFEVCWRANDREDDIYTISGTDKTLIEKVAYWTDLPPMLPTMSAGNFTVNLTFKY